MTMTLPTRRASSVADTTPDHASRPAPSLPTAHPTRRPSVTHTHTHAYAAAPDSPRHPAGLAPTYSAVALLDLAATPAEAPEPTIATLDTLRRALTARSAHTAAAAAAAAASSSTHNHNHTPHRSRANPSTLVTPPPPPPSTTTTSTTASPSTSSTANPQTNNERHRTPIHHHHQNHQHHHDFRFHPIAREHIQPPSENGHATTTRPLAEHIYEGRHLHHDLDEQPDEKDPEEIAASARLPGSAAACALAALRAHVGNVRVAHHAVSLLAHPSLVARNIDPVSLFASRLPMPNSANKHHHHHHHHSHHPHHSNHHHNHHHLHHHTITGHPQHSAPLPSDQQHSVAVPQASVAGAAHGHASATVSQGSLSSHRLSQSFRRENSKRSGGAHGNRSTESSVDGSASHQSSNHHRPRFSIALPVPSARYTRGSVFDYYQGDPDDRHHSYGGDRTAYPHPSSSATTFKSIVPGSMSMAVEAAVLEAMGNFPFSAAFQHTALAALSNTRHGEHLSSQSRDDILIAVIAAMRRYSTHPGILLRGIDLIAFHLNQSVALPSAELYRSSTDVVVEVARKLATTPHGASAVLLACVGVARWSAMHAGAGLLSGGGGHSGFAHSLSGAGGQALSFGLINGNHGCISGAHGGHKFVASHGIGGGPDRGIGRASGAGAVTVGAGGGSTGGNGIGPGKSSGVVTSGHASGTSSSKLLRGSGGTCINLVDALFVSCVVSSMRKHLAVPHVQVLGCETVRVAGKIAGRTLIATGAVEAVLATLETHSSDIAVVDRAIPALRAVILDTNSPKPALAMSNLESSGPSLGVGGPLDLCNRVISASEVAAGAVAHLSPDTSAVASVLAVDIRTAILVDSKKLGLSTDSNAKRDFFGLRRLARIIHRKTAGNGTGSGGMFSRSDQVLVGNYAEAPMRPEGWTGSSEFVVDGTGPPLSRENKRGPDLSGRNHVSKTKKDETVQHEISSSAMSQSAESASMPRTEQNAFSELERSSSIDGELAKHGPVFRGTSGAAMNDALYAFSEPQQVRANRRYRSVGGGVWSGKRRASRASIQGDSNWPRTPRDRVNSITFVGPDMGKLVRQPTINVGRTSLDGDYHGRRFHAGFL